MRWPPREEMSPERIEAAKRRDRANAADGAKGVRLRMANFAEEYSDLLTAQETAVLWSSGEILKGIEARLRA